MIDQDLIKAYRSAVSVEQAAKKDRIRLAGEIADALGRPDEGQQTHTAKDLGVSITVKQPVNRKVDWDAFFAASVGIGLEHLPFESKPHLDLVGLRWLEQHEHDAYLRLAKTITAKPGQVSITIKDL